MEDNLKSCIDDFFDDLVLYDDYYGNHNYKSILKANIDLFLENKSDYLAFEVYETFLMIYKIAAHDKSDSNEDVALNESNVPLDFARTMFKHEMLINEKHLNTFINSVNVFILGLAIYSRNSQYRRFFKNYVVRSPYGNYYRIDGEFSHEEFLYRWGIASLFHDIALPIEFMGKPMKKLLTGEINSVLNKKGETITVNLCDLEELNNIPKIDLGFIDKYRETYPETKFLNLFKPTDLLSHRIYLDFGLDKKQLNLLNNLIYRKFIVGDCPGLDNEIKDHGLLSSIITLKLYGYIIQNCKENPDLYFYPIADSSAAILLHNFFKNELLKEPFGLEQLHPSQNPISYLLILCDELQKGNFDDFNVFIDDRRFEAEYVLKGGSTGLGFSEDKESLLGRILSIRTLFRRDFWIQSHIENEDHILMEMVRAETRPTRPLLGNVERLAIQIHQQYVDQLTDIYNDAKARGIVDDSIKERYEALCEFNDLSPQLKMANIRQAISIPKKLNMIGCELANLADERYAITEFFEDEAVYLAMYEHEEWCEEKINQGWRYGKVKDSENLVTPYLVPWDNLAQEVRKLDINQVKAIPALVESVGLKIVRSKIRLLAFELFKFRTRFDNGMHFEDLPNALKNMNYIQTNNKIKLLVELGYDVVDVAMPGEAIAEFDRHLVECLAKREHEEWCKLKFNLGWKKGPKKDSLLKTNPFLVGWDEVNLDVKDYNREEFRHLPEICGNVGLKIVKKY